MGLAWNRWWRTHLEPLAAPRRLEAEQYQVAAAVRDFPRRRATGELQLPGEEVFRVGEVAP